MPGIGILNDKDFLRAFQVIDKVIQNNQPVFMLTWIGSILFIITSLILGIRQMEGINLLLLVIASVLYLFGVQLSTVINNIPLNNKLQKMNIDKISDKETLIVRADFERPWNRWNIVRTIISILVTTLLLIVVVQI
jgi:uncharacterized membrane protein